MKQILNLLGMTELEYNELMYTTGLAYLQHYIPGDEVAIATLERSRIFWAWWKNHWRLRDEQFIRNINPGHSRERGIAYYKWFNDAEELSNSIHPNGLILETSYAEMIGRFNDEIKTKI